jgi:DNA-binding beta-propeller fold protein YncE
MPPMGSVIPAPRDLAVGGTGEVYALDTAGRVLRFDASGTLQATWNMPESERGMPEGIWVLLDGRIVVADTHYHQVVVFDPDGRVTDQWGGHGTGPGEFIYPVAVTQDPAGRVYVAEYGSNDRVQVFTPHGKWLRSFGAFGTGPGAFQRPSGVAWLQDRLYVADAFNNRVQVFTEDGLFVGMLGGDDPPWSLHFPYDIDRTEDGRLMIVEYGAGRITEITADGVLVGRYGQTGSGVGDLATPWGLSVDQHRRVLVADTGNRRIVELSL